MVPARHDHQENGSPAPLIAAALIVLIVLIGVPLFLLLMRRQTAG